MKYITSMALIALLVLSMVPMVFADDAVSVETSVQATARDAKVSTDASADVRVKTAEKADSDESETFQDRVKNAREAKLGIGVETSSRFKELRVELQAKRADYKASVDELKAQKDSLKQCKAKDDENCKELRVKAKVQVQGVLANAVEKLTSAIAKAQFRIDNSQLSDADKASLKAQLTAETEKVAALKVKIDAINDASTKAEIQALNKEARTLWSEIKDVLQSMTSKLVATKLAGVVVRAEHLSTKLADVIAKAKANGKDVASAEAKIAQVNVDLEAAKALQVEAAALTGSERNEKIKAANEKLRSAHKTLMEIVKSLRDVKVNVDEAVSNTSSEKSEKARNNEKAESEDSAEESVEA